MSDGTFEHDIEPGDDSSQLIVELALGLGREVESATLGALAGACIALSDMKLKYAQAGLKARDSPECAATARALNLVREAIVDRHIGTVATADLSQVEPAPRMAADAQREIPRQTGVQLNQF